MLKYKGLQTIIAMITKDKVIKIREISAEFWQINAIEIEN